MKKFLLSCVAAAWLLLGSGCKESSLGPLNPEDEYYGPYTLITLGEEAEGVNASNFTLTLKAEDGTIIEREVTHSRRGGVSKIVLDRGLPEGTFRLLYGRNFSGKGDRYDEYGFGSRIHFSPDGVEVLDRFDPKMRCAGAGTSKDPYIVSSSTHLFNLMMAVNDYDSNRDITTGTKFEQVCDIDMKQMSRNCDSHYGWMPIGADANTPFRGTYDGGGYTVKNLTINRPKSVGVGLFGLVCDGAIEGLNMTDCTISGQYAVGCVAGGVITSGAGTRGTGTFTNCSVENTTLNCPETSAAVGGVLGAVDMHSRALLAGCKVEDSQISGGMNVGGIAGGAGIYSSVMISDCANSARVESALSGAGGMIGTADTLNVAGCSNRGLIMGALQASSDSPHLGAGGIAGGSGMAWISASTNFGAVKGNEGVGGIIGSTRVTGSQGGEFYYNQAMLRYCGNEGDVEGKNCVGGAIGEAQAGTYGVYNTGSVKGTDYVGGICGTTSIAVIHNTVNSGQVSGSRYVAGILGKCTWGSLALNQNNGKVTGTSGRTAGVIGLAGNNTILNYCSNFGEIEGPSSSPVGGIVAEVGDPRKWTGMDIAECVIGSLEIVTAFVGPCIAVAEGLIEFSHGAEIVLKVIEIVPDAILQLIDYSLLGYGIYEIVSPEVKAELKAAIEGRIAEVSGTIGSTMASLRENANATQANFSNPQLATNYAANVGKVLDYYEIEGNDEKFNESINEAREERAEKLEKIQKGKEILHAAIGGVAVVCSTVALIGGTIASGGTATAFLVMGTAAAIIGGTNAIVKSCTQFESNAVVISQCVNSGSVKSPGNNKASAIVGQLYDGCVVQDCFNSASLEVGDDKGFVGQSGSHTEISRCVSLVENNKREDGSNVKNSLFYDSSLNGAKKSFGSDNYRVSPDLFSSSTTYTECGFNMTSHWTIPAGFPYAIPNHSQMQK